MSYQEIKDKIDDCIFCLEVPKFANGTLKEIQSEVCNMATIIGDVNEYVKTIDDRVTILEEDGQGKPSPEFETELISIKGIGEETAKDILTIAPNKEVLIRKLKENKVPLRNDVVNKLRNKYG